MALKHCGCFNEELNTDSVIPYCPHLSSRKKRPANDNPAFIEIIFFLAKKGFD